MSMVGGTIVDEHCVQFIHQRTLLEVLFDEFLVFGLQFEELLLLFCLLLDGFGHFSGQFRFNGFALCIG